MGIIYTIGYEQTEIGSFIGTLKEVGIELLADVRAVALSRKKGFSKTALCHHLEAPEFDKPPNQRRNPPLL